jgi:hypothetical protein
MTDSQARADTATPQPPQDGAASGAQALLTTPVRVINVGLEGFATDLAAQGVPVTHVQWSPPAGGDERLAALLGKLGL